MINLTSKQILPPNASQLEIDVVSVVVNNINKIYADIKILTGAKTTNPHKSLLPYIIEEYGFGSVSKYIPDNDSFVSEGLKWTKERGTPAAIDRAFGWIFRQDELLENTKWWHWTVVEVRITQDLPDLSVIKDIVTLVRASLPARAKLLRVWSGTDLPMFTLNECELNDCRLNVPGGEWNEELKVWLYLNNKNDVVFISGASTMQAFSSVLNNVYLRQFPVLNDEDYLNGRNGPILIMDCPAFKSNHVTFTEGKNLVYGYITFNDPRTIATTRHHMALY